MSLQLTLVATRYFLTTAEPTSALKYMSKSKWKLERLAEYKLPDNAEIRKYHDLSERELVIVTYALIDVAMAELLSKCLQGEESEKISFLGADESPNAPLGTSSARMQLIHLFGLMTLKELQTLRVLKYIRNKMAHKVQCDLKGPLLKASFDKIRINFEERVVNNQMERATVDNVKSDPKTMFLILALIFQGTFQTLLKHAIPVATPLKGLS